MQVLRLWDRNTATNVDLFIANSSAVARRIRAHYGRDSVVIHPPVRTDFFTPGGERGDYFLFVGRLTGYKSPDVVLEAFRGQSHRLIVAGVGPRRASLEARAPSNVTFVGAVSDVELRDLYRGAIALVYPVNEDFGIAMAEAQACGTPVIGLRDGGAADIVVEGQTGLLIDSQDVRSIHTALERARQIKWDAQIVADYAQRFSSARFREQIVSTVSSALSRDVGA